VLTKYGRQSPAARSRAVAQREIHPDRDVPAGRREAIAAAMARANRFVPRSTVARPSAVSAPSRSCIAWIGAGSVA